MNFRKVKSIFQNTTKAVFHATAKAILRCTREVCKKGNISTELRMLMIQLAGAFAVLYGISYWSVAAALIVGGIGAIAAIETQAKSPEPDDPVVDQRIRAQIDAALSRGHNPFDSPIVPMTPKWLTYVALARKQ